MSSPPGVTDSDSEAEDGGRKDEYGERFEDYGFLKRAEEHKKAGNTLFQKERYEKALKEYDGALDQLVTVAYDKSIVIGKQKWNDVVVLRSTIHLNKSTCHFKLGAWQKAVDEAQECLNGNMREQLMFTDPHVRAKVREAERKQGAAGVTYVEDRLPRPTKAKAWFRLAKCYANLEYLDRAREATAKALENCDDKAMLTEISQQSVRLDALEKRQKQRQKNQFKGFFDKLQERGGYLDAKAQMKARWDSLEYEEKIKLAEELDDSDGEDLGLSAYQGPAPGQLAAQRRDQEAPQSSVERERTRQLNMSFEEYLERQDVMTKAGVPQGGEAPSQQPLAALQDDGQEQPPPPQKEGPLEPSIDASRGGGPYGAADIMPQRAEDARRREFAWRQRRKEQEMDDLEEEELRKARERLAKKKQVPRGGERTRRAARMADDSDL